MASYPSDINDLWRQRICDAKRLGGLSNDALDASHVNISFSAPGRALSDEPSGPNGILEDRSNKGAITRGRAP